jgi:hypothetical protein
MHRALAGGVYSPAIGPPASEVQMAHEVSAKLHTKVVANKDLEIEIKAGTGASKAKLGTLLISQGNIEWVPANKQYKRRLTWTKFDAVMRAAGKATRKKPRAAS